MHNTSLHTYCEGGSDVTDIAWNCDVTV